MDRWYAEYHARENAADKLARAYGALGIPEDHIRVFNLDLLSSEPAKGDNPFHPSTITNKGYAGEWAFMFGRMLN